MHKIIIKKMDQMNSHSHNVSNPVLFACVRMRPRACVLACCVFPTQGLLGGRAECRAGGRRHACRPGGPASCRGSGLASQIGRAHV